MNKLQLKNVLWLLFLVLINQKTHADVKLPSLVGNHMVLQRNVPVRIWGWADPGERVSVNIKNQHKRTRANRNGSWEIMLDAEPAGGPYQLTVTGKNQITLEDILFGEVWIASGQSNMEWPLRQTNNAEIEIMTADFPEIRLFTVKRDFTFEPVQDVKSNGWQVCSPETVRNFSAVAYLFGRELHQHLGVPFGLIHSSWGGTTAQTWTSQEGLREIPELHTAALNVGKILQSDYEQYVHQKELWWEPEGNRDRGRQPGAPNWADPDLNTESWPEMQLPGNWYDVPELHKFGGTVWLRKEIELDSEVISQKALVGIGNVTESDSVFVNGTFVGSNKGYNPKRIYAVPEGVLRPGKNIIAIRQVGQSEFGGLFGEPDDLFFRIEGQNQPLSGTWKYRTGPDLTTFPVLEGVPDFSITMPQSPFLLYNAMLKPLTPYTIKGAIWYQGESNASNREEALQYARLFPAMIHDWRRLWGYEFPFLYVQLANFMQDSEMPADTPWAQLRKAQTDALELPNTGMAVTIDIGNPNDIHPRNKQDVAHRLALQGRHLAYHENLTFSGPKFKSLERIANRLHIHFEHSGNGLKVKDAYGYLKGFAIAGRDGQFFWAQAKVADETVSVWSDKVPQPVAVRYNWGNSPDGNLYNVEDLPAIPFWAELENE